MSDIHSSRNKLIVAAINQSYLEGPNEYINGEKKDSIIGCYKDVLLEIATTAKLRHNEKSITIAAKYLFDDVSLFIKGEKSMEKVDRKIYQPSVSQIKNLIEASFDAAAK